MRIFTGVPQEDLNEVGPPACAAEAAGYDADCDVGEPERSLFLSLGGGRA